MYFLMHRFVVSELNLQLSLKMETVTDELTKQQKESELLKTKCTELEQTASGSTGSAGLARLQPFLVSLSLRM